MTIDDRTTGRRIIIAILLIGVLASAAAAVVPNYSNHYRLDVGVLSAGLLPYLVYGVMGWIAPRGHVLHLVGGLNLLAHLWLVATDRFMAFNDYQDGAIYYSPLLFAVLLLVAGLMNAQRAGKELAPE